MASEQGLTWGAAEPQADAVAAAMGRVRAVIQDMADAADEAAFSAANGRLPAAERALLTAANALRAVLGLPPSTY